MSALAGLFSLGYPGLSTVPSAVENQRGRFAMGQLQSHLAKGENTKRNEGQWPLADPPYGVDNGGNQGDPRKRGSRSPQKQKDLPSPEFVPDWPSVPPGSPREKVGLFAPEQEAPGPWGRFCPCRVPVRGHWRGLISEGLYHHPLYVSCDPLSSCPELAVRVSRPPVSGQRLTAGGGSPDSC